MILYLNFEISTSEYFVYSNSLRRKHVIQFLCDLYNLLWNFFFVLYADGIFCWMIGRLKAVEKLSRKRVNHDINNCYFEQRKMRDLQIYF